MKKIIFCIFSLSVLLFSCKKDHATHPSAKTYKVSFNVGFSQTTGPFKTITNSLIKNNSLIKTNAAIDTATDSVKYYANHLYYVIFDSNQHIVQYIQQTTGQANFGTDTAQLVSGTYTVVVFGGDENLQNNVASIKASNGTNPNFWYTNPLFNSPTDPNALPPFEANTFYKRLAITVGPTATSYNYSLNLDRVVGQLEVVIQDFLPTDLSGLIYTVTGDASKLSVFNATPTTGEAIPYSSISYVPGTANTTYYMIIANTTAPFTVELTGYTTNKTYDKKITGVTCKPNQTTILTGKLFTTSGTNDANFNVTYSTTWNTSTPTVVHF